MFAGAGLAGHMVVLFLSIARWWAVIVAVLGGIIAVVLALKGKSFFKKVGGIPQTADSIKKIPNAIKPDQEAQR